jgi:hypothetical protein
MARWKVNSRVHTSQLAVSAGTQNRFPVRLGFNAQLLLALAAFLLCGCEQKTQRPALETYPVTGKVVTTGKLPVGGCVQLQPKLNGLEYMAKGVIDEQGRFTLRVPYVDRVIPGATAGPHTAQVLMPLDQGGAAVPIEGTFEVRQGANDFTVEMPAVVGG